MAPITKNNYLAAYCKWCNDYGTKPLRYDILIEVFYGCQDSTEYDMVLRTLYQIHKELFQLSFMKDTNSLEALKLRLLIRLKLFDRVPTATNMLLAYNLIEEITLKVAASGKSDMLDKDLERFDKLKNLALGTKYINERKLAFERSVEMFKKLTEVK